MPYGRRQSTIFRNNPLPNVVLVSYYVLYTVSPPARRLSRSMSAVVCAFILLVAGRYLPGWILEHDDNNSGLALQQQKRAVSFNEEGSLHPQHQMLR